MQRVVRSTLVGLLTIAGITACGDKVTVPPPVTTPQGTVVHNVSVTPQTATVAVGAKIILAAAVDADAGVTDRTVTWTSSDNTVATVGTDGTVTGVKAGTVTITAASHADPNVKGAAIVTVGGGGGPVTVLISSINQTNAQGQSVPANLANAAGQLDVVLDVESGGQALKTVQATLTCGSKTMTRTQTIGAAAPSATDAEAAQANVTLSFPTNEFNSTTGAPTLLNGPCTISASATTAAGTQSATNSQSLTLNNPDVVVVTSAFSGGSTATDRVGVPWKSGALTVSALPVLYSGRTVSSVTVGLNGVDPTTGNAIGKSVTVTTPTSGAFSASFPNATSGGSSAARIGQITLAGSTFDALGVAQPVVPTVIAIDSQGNEVPLANSNAAASGFRLDNQSPNAPTTATIPTRQQGWVNGTYVFTGTGGASSSTKYVSGGDNGVSNGSVSSSTGLNGQTTFTYFVMAASGYAGNGLTNGTAAGTANCPTTGWTQVATGGDLAETANNQAYVVRILETDKLGNVRCTDVGTGIGGAFTVMTFGVDKTPPTAKLLGSADQAGAADSNQAITAAPFPSFTVSLSDNASGFSSTPLLTTITLLAINPATGVAATPTDANGFGCPTGLDGNGNCSPVATSSTIPVDNGKNVDGYYTFTANALDLARNQSGTLTREVVIDRAAPVVGGVQVPATINGGTTASFATSATDNLDLVSSNYSLQYGNNPTNSPAATFVIRTPGPTLGAAFDNVLTTASSFSVNVNNFIRNLQTADANGTPIANAGTGGPSSITVRAYDAAGNSGSSGAVAINGANVPGSNGTLAGQTIYANNQANGTHFITTGGGWSIPTGTGNISNCNAACTPSAPTSMTLTAVANGSETTTAQFTNPFSQVQFYYLDPTTNEWTFIGTAVAPTVTDNNTQTIRSFTWSLSTPFDPPVSAGQSGTLKLIAVGVNSTGDALATPVNANTTLVNP